MSGLCCKGQRSVSIEVLSIGSHKQPKNRFCIDKKQSCQTEASCIRMCRRPIFGCLIVIPWGCRMVQKVSPKAPSPPIPKSPSKIMNHEIKWQILTSHFTFTIQQWYFVCVGHKQKLCKWLVNISKVFSFQISFQGWYGAISQKMIIPTSFLKLGETVKYLQKFIGFIWCFVSFQYHLPFSQLGSPCASKDFATSRSPQQAT